MQSHRYGLKFRSNFIFFMILYNFFKLFGQFSTSFAPKIVLILHVFLFIPLLISDFNTHERQR